VLRIDGDRVQRMGGWHIAGEHASAAGGAVTADELVDGIPAMYGAIPAGVNTLTAPGR
jgi:hypothetical protein